MTLDTVIMLFGAIVAALPFLQFPRDWTDFFAFIAGIVIIGLGIAARRRGFRQDSVSGHEAPLDPQSPQESVPAPEEE